MVIVLSGDEFRPGFGTLLFALDGRHDRGDPVIHNAVALKAVRGEPLRLMVRRFRLTKVVEVAAHTLGGEALAVERTYRPDLLSGIAIYPRVRPHERQAALLLVYG